MKLSTLNPGQNAAGELFIRKAFFLFSWITLPAALFKNQKKKKKRKEKIK